MRQRLVGVRQQLQQPLTEQAGFVESSLQKQLTKNCQASLKAINADLEVVDKQIDELIQGDDRLKELFGWITSIPGVGSATATEVLAATDEFKAINNAKKLAASAVRLPCWCSLFWIPIGSSVRGKTRVSQHARLRSAGCPVEICFSSGSYVCHPHGGRATRLLSAQGYGGQE